MSVFWECEGVRSRSRVCVPRGEPGVQEETEALTYRQALHDEMGWVIVFGPANGSPLLTSLCWAGPQKKTKTKQETSQVFLESKDTPRLSRLSISRKAWFLMVMVQPCPLSPRQAPGHSHSCSSQPRPCRLSSSFLGGHWISGLCPSSLPRKQRQRKSGS